MVSGQRLGLKLGEAEDYADLEAPGKAGVGLYVVGVEQLAEVAAAEAEAAGESHTFPRAYPVGVA